MGDGLHRVVQAVATLYIRMYRSSEAVSPFLPVHGVKSASTVDTSILIPAVWAMCSVICCAQT
ncbi:hypothetical protein ACIQI7_14235 [Kitasatospora sp. NPDC092039]|uniref:hypothetical protein n=1 Tax=Kitasatospora sp. NPDC092039 TaxID=3364086 RepID=UPI0038119C67